MVPSLFKRLAVVTFVGCAFALGSSQPLAARTLAQALDELAGEIQAYLSSKGMNTVKVEAFQGPADASGGRRIQEELSTRLQAADIEVKKIALKSWVISGNYQYQPVDDAGVVLIRSELRDENGGPQNEFRERIQVERVDNLSDLTELLGLTGDFTGGEEVAGDETTSTAEVQQQRPRLVQARNAALTKSRENPSFHLVNTSVVAATEKSPYRIELLVKRAQTYDPLEIVDVEGFAFAPLQDGDHYAVKLINDSDHDVGVRLSIDGLNSFVLSEVPYYQQHGMWVVRAHRQGIVHGWHRTDDDLFLFRITSKPDEFVASKLGMPTSNIGTITAAFFPAWDPSGPPPVIERALVGDRSLGIGTGQGPLAGVRSTPTLRKFGKTLLASVSIRYENPDPPKDLPTDGPEN